MRASFLGANLAVMFGGTSADFARLAFGDRKCVAEQRMSFSPEADFMDSNSNVDPSASAEETSPLLEITLAKNLARLFKLLADESRLQILHRLMHEPELSVCEFVARINQSQPATSHHLKLLLEAGLVSKRRSGRHNYYRLVPKRFHELISAALDVLPLKERIYRIEDYVLAHSPPNVKPAE
jgi:ArsR family transcriptional regulator